MKQILQVPYLIFCLLLLIVDVSLRYQIIGAWSWSELRTWLICVPLSVLFWKSLFDLCASTIRRQQRVGWPISIAIALMATLLLWLPLVVFAHYGVFPTREGFLFFANLISFTVESVSGMAAFGDMALYIVLLAAVMLTVAATNKWKQQVWSYKTSLSVIAFFILAISFVNLRPSIPVTLEANTIRFLSRMVAWGNSPPSFFNLSQRHPETVTPVQGFNGPNANYLFIISEAIAAPYLPEFGSSTAPAPNLSRLLDLPGTVSFKSLHANSSCTDLAVPSLLTGIYPTAPLGQLLGSRLATDYFKPHGYNTFLVSSHSLAWAHLDRFIGRDNIDFLQSADDIEENPSHNFGISDTITYKSALERMDVSASANRRFFGIIHLNTTHSPYQVDDKNLLYREDLQGSPGGPIFTRYLNSVNYFDAMLGDFFGEFSKTSLARDTIVVFTSDHGEAFGQHGISMHCGKYYREESHLPGFVYIPKDLRSQPDISRMWQHLQDNRNEYVTNLDLLPTLLDLAGIYQPYYADTMDGFPLTRRLSSERIYYFSNCSEFRRCPIPHFGFYKGGSKFLYHADSHNWEVFDLSKDPLELHNIAPSNKQTIDEILPELRKTNTFRQLLDR